MDTESKSILLDGKIFTYFLERKKVKNINLRIKKDGKIRVSASKKVSEEVIERFIKSKERLIIRAIEKAEDKKAENDDIYSLGSEVGYFGSKLKVKLIKSVKEDVKASGECLYIYTKDEEDSLKIKKLVKKWEIKIAREVFREMSDKIYPYFQKLGVKYPSISIRNMTSRWGSCMPDKGKVTLNLKLIHFPKECIEYVIVHEFSHFIHPDHSKRFWEFVESIMPDYRARKKKLNDV